MAVGHTYLSLRELFDWYSNVLRVMELTKLKMSCPESHNSKWDNINPWKLVSSD